MARHVGRYGFAVGIAVALFAHLAFEATRPAPPQTMGDAYYIIAWALVLGGLWLAGVALAVGAPAWSFYQRRAA